MTQRLPVYLDCNATTPVEEEVIDAMTVCLRAEYGNSASRTHRFGTAAAQAVRHAREQVAAVVDASWENVIFTSGATESNNLAILGLSAEAEKLGKKHVISTQIEHKAVLEPIEELSRRGFEITLIPPDSGGAIDADTVADSLRPDTFLVSVMHVNNETGVTQPLEAIAQVLENHHAVFHTDSAQGFGKDLDALRNPRLDLISISAHKIFGPKGVGALIDRPSVRTRRLQPLMFGGGQEWGLRPGTLAVHLAVGLGLAAELAIRDHSYRRQRCLEFRAALLEAITPLQPTFHGNMDLMLPNVLNLRLGDIDSEAIMLSLKDIVAISNGSACTSARHEPSHVLRAMGIPAKDIECATRWSWSHLTAPVDWASVYRAIKVLH